MTSDARYFAILGAMRTGSNLLEKTLEALGDTVCYGEAFNPGFISGPRKEEVLGFDLDRRTADPFGFLDAMIRSEPGSVAGFRIFQGHDSAILEHILRDPHCTRIILTRNPLDSYVSLKIARQTDQWMLRNPRRRTMARMRFDAEEYARYHTRLKAHYDWLDQCMATHGTDAVRVDYSNLSDHVVLQRIAGHIGSTGLVPSQPPTLRQNPEPLSTKVENYAEMCDALGFQPDEEAAPPVDARALELMAPNGFPVAYAPIPGCAFLPVITLLNRIESRDLGLEKLTPSAMVDRAYRGVLYPARYDDLRTVFTMVCDPFARLHAAFVEEVLGPGWQASMIRRTLMQQHGGIPPPRGLSRGRAEYPQSLHQIHFAAYVEIVAQALHGQGAFPLCVDWTPQSDLIDQHAGKAEIARVFRHETFEQAVNWLTDCMKLAPFPPGQINGMRLADQQSLLPIEDVRTPQLCAAVQELYATDYARFGPF